MAGWWQASDMTDEMMLEAVPQLSVVCLALYVGESTDSTRVLVPTARYAVLLPNGWSTSSTHIRRSAGFVKMHSISTSEPFGTYSSSGSGGTSFWFTSTATSLGFEDEQPALKIQVPEHNDSSAA